MPDEVGEFIRARRRELGLTQQQLAVRASISVRAVRDIERGQVRQPRAESLRRIFDVIGAGPPAPEPAGLAPGRPPELRIAILGPLTVHLAAEPVTLPYREGQVLGALALHAGTPVSRRDLVDLLWAHDPPHSCHNLVHTYIARLRRRFGTVYEHGADSLIDTLGDRYRLRAGSLHLDVVAFVQLADPARNGLRDGTTDSPAPVDQADDHDGLHRLGRALALWRGPVLAGTGPELSRHPAAMAFNRQRVVIATRYAALAVELGRPEDAIRELQSVADHEPLHEQLHALLMRTLAGCGQQARALELYREVHDRLADQLGVGPGPELRETHLRILRQEEPAPAPGSHTPEQPPVVLPAADAARVERVASATADRPAVDLPTGSGHAARKSHPPLYGRDEQLATLDGLAEAARAGHGAVVFVSGAAGMGKTALLDAWAARERAGGMRVTRATAGKAEQGFGFAVARQLLDRLAADIAAPPPAAVGDEPPHEILHSLYRLVVRACDDGPLAMLVDDAQWADPPSARWLDYLARRIAGLPVLLVVAARSDGGAAEQPGGHAIVLPELPPEAVTRWVRQEWPDAAVEFHQACAAAAEGDPSLLGELLRVLREQGVQPVAEQAPRVAEVADRLQATAVVRRLSGQDEATRRLARALVVLGDGADWPVLAALSGLGEAESRDRADQLRRIGLLAVGGAARFRHPAVRSVLSEAVMTAGELAAGHARAAELLHADGAPAALVAEHVLLAEPGETWRVEVLREAARAARGRGTPEVGAGYLRRALREPVSAEQRGDLVLELGADEAVSDPEAAARRLAVALTGLADPLTRARVASLLAEALTAVHRYDQAMEVLERELADLGESAGSDGPVREIWLRLQAQLVLVAYQSPATFPTARLWAQRLRAFDVAGDTPGQRAVLLALAMPAMMGEGDAATVNDLLDRGLRGDVATEARAAYMLGLAGQGYTLTDRLDDAALRYGQMRDLAGRYGAALPAARAVAGLVNVAWYRGERVPIVPPIEGALLTDVRSRLQLVTIALNSLVERGDPEAAAEFLAQYASGAVDSAAWATVLVTAGRVRAECGDLSGGLALLLAYGGFERQAGLGNPAAAPWRTTAARICAALGQREQARELADEALEAAHRWGTARVIGDALRCLGTVLGGAEGRALLADAVAVLEPSPARLEFAWAKYEWGLAVRQGGDPRTGVGLLGEALRLAELSGAHLLAGRVRAELVAAGVRLGP
jgi:DNA-binding SARP family transcriptional activator/tetratricopeptide (TPR) repeat protein